jgi:hypothetical protein
VKLMRSPEPATESTREKTTVVAAAWAVVIPLLLVNLLAAVGQVLWAQENLVGDLPPRIATALPVLFAGAVESIALFLAYQAHQARLAGDSAGYLSVAAYGWAAVAAWLQWSHWSPTGLTAAVVYAAMSALSPWLWGIWSRSIHRAQLRTAGLIEERSVRFGRARWLLYPVRTFRVFREAVWAGESDPIGAIDRHDPGPRAPRERTPGAWAPRLKRGKRAAAEAAPTDRPADQPPAPNPDPVADAVPPTPATGSDTKQSAKPATKKAPATPPPPPVVTDGPWPPAEAVHVAEWDQTRQVAWFSRHKVAGRTVAEMESATAVPARTIERRLQKARQSAAPPQKMPATDGATELQESTS